MRLRVTLGPTSKGVLIEKKSGAENSVDGGVIVDRMCYGAAACTGSMPVGPDYVDMIEDRQVRL